jgi:hypothetical protein
MIIYRAHEHGELRAKNIATALRLFTFSFSVYAAAILTRAYLIW